MTEEAYIELVDVYKNKIIEIVNKTGNLPANISLFVEKKEDKDGSTNPDVLIMEIPDQFMVSDESKDFFVDMILPSIFKKFSEKYTISGIGFTSESWLREATQEQLDEVDDYKDLPIKKEIVVMGLDSDIKSETIIYDIKNLGLQVSGEKSGFIKNVELVVNPALSGLITVSGRFVNLYKKMKDNV